MIATPGFEVAYSTAVSTVLPLNVAMNWSGEFFSSHGFAGGNGELVRRRGIADYILT